MESILKSNIFPHTSRFGNLITRAGIRYGTVLYLSFGTPYIQRVTNTKSITRCPVEFEIGTDYWEIYDENEIVLDSEYEDIASARCEIKNLMVGKGIINISINNSSSRVYISHGVHIFVELSKQPASGFSYTLDVAGGPSWETVDGTRFSVG